MVSAWLRMSVNGRFSVVLVSLEMPELRMAMGCSSLELMYDVWLGTRCSCVCANAADVSPGCGA